MIEKATGEASGSLYRDKVYTRRGQGIVIKTHELDGSRYDRAIVLVRNPFDVIESFWHWRINVNREKLSRKDFDEHVARTAEGWKRHLEHWEGLAYPKTVLRYEDMLADPTRSLRQMLRLLEIQIPPARIRAAVRGTRFSELKSGVENKALASFFRRGKSGYGKSCLTAGQAKVVRRIAGAAMKKYRYL